MFDCLYLERFVSACISFPHSTDFSAKAHYAGEISAIGNYITLMNEDQTLHSIEREALLSLLSWYRTMGVDAAISSSTNDWLARGNVPPLNATGLIQQSTTVKQKNAAVSAPARTFVITPPDAAEAEAREVARTAKNLQSLREALALFDGCSLKATAKNLCFFRGAETARVMVIGEAPGRDEDLSGMPFVGRAGQLLDKMLRAISLDDSGVHLTNVVYWRPPGNRTPTPQEVLVCRPFLERQIDLVAPEIIITLGGPAAKAILNISQGIMKSRGKWGEVSTQSGAKLRVMPTLHPAYLLRTPAAKRLTWRDLLAAQEVLQKTTAPD